MSYREKERGQERCQGRGLTAGPGSRPGWYDVSPQVWRFPRFFFSSRRRHTRSLCDWSSDVCSSDLARVTRGIDEHPPDLAPDEPDPAEQLDPWRKPERALERRRDRSLGRPALDRQQSPNEIRPPVAEPERLGAADRMRKDEGIAHVQRVEHGGDAIGLGGERVIRLLGPGGRADAQRLDDDRPITRAD